MLPAALGSSVVRPFYNRGASGPPPIIRTPLGTASASSGLGISVVTIPGVVVAAGETLIAGICFNLPLGAFLSVDVGGVGLTVSQLGGSFSVPSLRLVLCYITAAQAPYSGNLVFDFTASAPPPTAAVALASKVSGLTTTAPLDKSILANGVASSTQDSGLTAATTWASEYINGIIGTDGSFGDSVGAWQAGMAAGQHIEAIGPCIKEGWQVVSAIGTYRARVTSATSRRWGARCDTFKGV